PARPLLWARRVVLRGGRCYLVGESVRHFPQSPFRPVANKRIHCLLHVDVGRRRGELRYLFRLGGGRGARQPSSVPRCRGGQPRGHARELPDVALPAVPARIKNWGQTTISRRKRDRGLTPNSNYQSPPQSSSDWR